MSLASVTCIIPVWNGEKYIVEALDSVASQVLPCTLVIVVDDGSTDSTAQIISEYRKLKIHYIRHGNHGPAEARNQGLHLADSEFVAFLDADDRWHAQKLEKQVACLKESPELQFCISYSQNFWSPELSEEIKPEIPGLLEPWIAHWYGALVARRSVFQLVGFLNTEMRVGEDIDWFARAARAGASYKTVPEVLTFRRLHPGNLSRQNPEVSRDALLRTAKSLLDWKRGLTKGG